MGDMVALKNKHLKITDLQMKELLQEQVKLINYVQREQNQLSSEDELKIKELTSKVTSMKQCLQTEKQTLQHKNHELSKHSDSIAELEVEKNKLSEENQSLEVQRNKLKCCKRNLHDQEVLDKGRKKLTLYRQLTRIRWDYENIRESIIGYVSNNRDYIHHFNYKSENTDLTELLWQEIYQSSNCMDNNDVHNKENVVQNQ
ncbi:uncharacterized protein LOC143188171 [Calliopsis andreniformis]|uniref:uncharacterized protein LOC143188171 n=1 Tax=Calliopsis andreniformis TaxID=337506 RepID=UPI003FCE2DA5